MVLVFERELHRMQECIRARRYFVTLHAAEEAVEDGLTRFDLESIVLTGRVVERQKDPLSGEWKYLIRGDTMNAQRATVVTRLGATGILILITVFRESDES
jgi:hypothetical protein